MLTPHCSAASGIVAPSSTTTTTRARKSSEYGFAILAGLLPAGSLNHIRAGKGIPLRFNLLGKRSNGRTLGRGGTNHESEFSALLHLAPRLANMPSREKNA